MEQMMKYSKLFKHNKFECIFSMLEKELVSVVQAIRCSLFVVFLEILLINMFISRTNLFCELFLYEIASGGGNYYSILR